MRRSRAAARARTRSATWRPARIVFSTGGANQRSTLFWRRPVVGRIEERDREEREADVRRDDAHAEARAEDAAPRLEDELDAVAHEDEDEREDEDDDDVEEDEQEHPVRRGRGRELARAEHERVAAREGRAEREPDREEDAVVARPPVRGDGRDGLRQRAPLVVHSKIPDRAQAVSSLVGTTPSATPLP